MNLYWWNEKRNLGDLLNTVLFPKAQWSPVWRADTFAIGSVLELCDKMPADIFGTGRAGPIRGTTDLSAATVYALRGYLSENLATDARPLAYGDPALLVPDFIPRGPKHGEIVYVPHHLDASEAVKSAIRVDVAGDVEEAVALISGASLVVSSALHGIVLADAYHIPRVALRSETNQPFKFADYGTIVGWPGYGTTFTPDRDRLDKVVGRLREARKALLDHPRPEPPATS